MARLITALSVAALTVVVTSAAPVPKTAPKGPWFYPTAVGTKWVYDNNGLEWVEEVIRAEERDGATRLTVRVTAPQAMDDTFRIDKRGVYWLTFGRYKMEQYRLRFPLDAGNSWEVRTPVQTGLAAQDGRMTVGKEEAVEVPAGTYRAVPVVFETTDEGGRPLPQPVFQTFWYAPGVGLVKQTYPGGQRVLTSFTPGRR